MNRNRVLFIANSVYQLLTAIHIKRSIEKVHEADLIITDVTPRLKECIHRIEDAGVFKRILFARTKELPGRYMTGTAAEIAEAFESRDVLLQWILNEELTEYSVVYFSNFDLLARLLACRFHETACSFICYEDGFSTYVIDYLRPDRAAVNRNKDGIRIRQKVKKVLLYEPGLAMRGDGIPNDRLPKIHLEDGELREILNYVFEYKKKEDGTDFVFLEQSFRAEKIQSNDIELMEECCKTVGAERFIVKPHPRNPENVPFQKGISRRYQSDVPWELLLMNEGTGNRKVITVCSNAALTGRIVFGLDIPVVMLYLLFQGKVLWKEDKMLWEYLKRFQRQYAGKNYYVPQTVYEMRNVLKYLGGCDES